MQNTPHLNTKTLVMASLLAALCCVATMVIRIPSPTGGYMNLGDTVVILSAYLLGPAWGAAASGLGSALADLFSGYTAYVPGTLVIKALMAACAAWIYLLMKKRAAALPVAALAVLVFFTGYLLQLNIGLQ